MKQILSSQFLLPTAQVDAGGNPRAGALATPANVDFLATWLSQWPNAAANADPTRPEAATAPLPQSAVAELDAGGGKPLPSSGSRPPTDGAPLPPEPALLRVESADLPVAADHTHIASPAVAAAVEHRPLLAPEVASPTERITATVSAASPAPAADKARPVAADTTTPVPVRAEPATGRLLPERAVSGTAHGIGPATGLAADAEPGRMPQPALAGAAARQPVPDVVASTPRPGVIEKVSSARSVEPDASITAGRERGTTTAATHAQIPAPLPAALTLAAPAPSGEAAALLAPRPGPARSDNQPLSLTSAVRVMGETDTGDATVLTSRDAQQSGLPLRAASPVLLPSVVEYQPPADAGLAATSPEARETGDKPGGGTPSVAASVEVNAQRHAESVSVGRAAGPGATLDLSNHQALAERLGERVTIMLAQNLQQARVAVAPAELGPVDIRISQQGDEVSVHLLASHALTRDALESALPRLRESFSDAGIALGDAQVSTGQSGNETAPGSDEAQRRPGDPVDAGDPGDAVQVAGFVQQGLVDAYV